MPSFARYFGFDLPEPVEEVESRCPVLMPEVHGSLLSVVEQESLEPVRACLSHKRQLIDQMADPKLRLPCSKIWQGQSNGIGPALYCAIAKVFIILLQEMHPD